MTEQYKHQGEGYAPFLIREGWQVAQLNYAPSLSVEKIDRLDIHYHTDEAFLLMAGEAVLVSAKIADQGIQYDMQKMEAGIIYNIPKEVWHTISLKPGAQVLIIEKDNTHLGDYEFYFFNTAEQQDFANLMKACYRNGEV
ncbi:hypothetical protein [Persicobacter psychrovividus]|uniref:Cupin n=1 Tax=Persicobacter psychrovividus TaxID=387638 RepID=A0ABN6LL28_9BACT|nr:hypothetical protein PEPS_44370 [Persicobacter psychrovividus]